MKTVEQLFSFALNAAKGDETKAVVALRKAAATDGSAKILAAKVNCTEGEVAPVLAAIAAADESLDFGALIKAVEVALAPEEEVDLLGDVEEEVNLLDEVQATEKPEVTPKADPAPAAKLAKKNSGGSGKSEGQNIAQRLYHSMVGFGAKPDAAVAVIKGKVPSDPAHALEDDDEDLVVAEGVRWTALRIWDEAFETTRYICKTKDNPEANKRFQNAIVAIARGSHTLGKFHTGLDEYLQRPNPREIKDGAAELTDWQLDLRDFKIGLESKAAAGKSAPATEASDDNEAAAEETATESDEEPSIEELLAASQGLGED